MRKLQQTWSPVDGSLYVERPYANPRQIAAAAAAAVKAQAAWQRVPLAERQALCRRAVDGLVARQDAIAVELCWQMGRPIRYGAGEVAGFAERARYMIEIADTALDPLLLPDKPGFRRLIRREPLGVVLLIAPWNYPYLTVVNTLVPALLAGNAVLLKHSAQTPLCAERLQQAFDAAGLPAGLFQHLHLTHADTEALIGADAIDYVAFTGSTAGGARVERAAAGRFIGVGLELGGKDPAYVRADADLGHAVATLVDGAYFNSGQSCCAIERIYVHDLLYEEFVARAVARVRQYRLGRPDDPATTLGPLVRAAAADFVRGQIAAALAAGAVAHIDPAEFPLDRPGSPYLAPQLLTRVDHSLRLMTEESFGPVVGVQRVATDAEALALMNDSDYGLTAAIFTRDIDAGVALGEQVACGTLFLNRCDYLDPALAWSGVKGSGRGCSLSPLGFASLTRPKSFHIQTAP